jgi:hypothetical protein
MKFGEQPTYSRQAYEDTEKGIQDVKDTARGDASVEELRALVSEKQSLESQKADLHGQAFDEATEMNRERDALAEERAAKEASDTAEADRLRAEILGEAATPETASLEEVPVERESKTIASTAEMPLAVNTDSEESIVTLEQEEPAQKTESSRGFFDKMKSFFSGEKQEEPKESLVGKLKDFLGKPKENGEYREMVDERGNFDIKNAYSNIKSKKWRQEKFEKGVAFVGATATLLSGSGLLAGGLAGVGIEGGAATIAATSPLIGAAMSGALYAVPAVGIGAAAAWGGVKLWNMYKRRKALRAADELFIREHGNDKKDAWNKGTLQGLRSDYGL